MFNKQTIGGWSYAHIRDEIKDQKRWIAKARRDGMHTGMAEKYLNSLYRELNSRSNSGVIW